MISTLTNGEHEIFMRDYVPPPKCSNNKENHMVANTNGFFDGLPIQNSKKKGSASMFESKEQREDRKMKKMIA